ncbi:major facilitator superfamily-like protein [Fragilaria crotonensis]|nr:major facilitator superfamily-like protein [Fragilaria crotonensis]
MNYSAKLLEDDFTPNQVSGPEKSFTELLEESGSDKYYRHHFERYYSDWFEPFRKKRNLKILEIGAKGGKSISLWDNYFEHAELILGLAYAYGTENLPEVIPGMRQNVRVHFGDQSTRETMQVLADAGPFDIIIDDGSHVPQHVRFSLFALEIIAPGGWDIRD